MTVKFITHVALYCRDLEFSSSWYQRLLGMKVQASAPGRFSALSFGHKHHDLALVQAPKEFADPQRGQVGLYHISIDTGSFEESVDIYRRAMAENNEFVKAIDHRVGHGIYLRDPDGNIIELWSEVYPSMEEAVAQLDKFDPPFAQNPIGYPLDIAAVAATGKPVHLSADAGTAGAPDPVTHR